MSLADIFARRPRPSDRMLTYGPGTEHVMEVWDGGAERAVVVLHGGFWAARYDRAHIRPLCAALAERGHPTVAVEYHRVGQAGGGWPGTFDDVATALDAVPQLTDTVLIGHSAGGQLALWAAMRADRGLMPRGVVSLAGVCDLGRAYDLDLGGGAVRDLLGGSPDERPERYAAADPMRLLPTDVRCVLVHGDRDDRVPVDISGRFADAMAATDGDVRLTTLAGLGHFELIDPTHAAFDVLVDAIRSF